MSAVDSNELLLPPSARLVHIGPHKTGTTSLQRSLHRSRDTLHQHGVHYAGPSPQPIIATLAVTGGPGRKGDRKPKPEDWTRLTDEIRDAGDQRVVLSSEFFDHADDEAARRVVHDVTGGPIHVVVTLRPIGKIIPSQWQQWVQNGRRTPYVEWLRSLFPEPPEESTERLFWHRHSHGEQVRRWADAVGPENLTVIVADDADPDLLSHTFESMVGLPEGVLDRTEVSNRSLTLAETEMVRQVNQYFVDHNWSGGWSEAVHANLMREGALRQMKVKRQPAPGEARVTTPAWALTRANERGARDIEIIESTGVRVIGDLPSLASVPVGDADESAMTASRLRADALGHAVTGVITGRGASKRGNRAGAVLAVLGALGSGEEEVDETGMPLVPIDAAARTVAGAIEARGAHSELSQLPSVPAAVAGVAVHAAAWAAGARETTSAGYLPALAEALNLPSDGTNRLTGKTKHDSGKGRGTRAAASGSADKTPIDMLAVHDVSARNLLAIVADRGVRRVRRKLRR